MNKKSPFIIYSESTPNPQVMKFVSNKILVSAPKECKSVSETGKSTLLRKLFTFPFVQELFVASNYISIKKNETTDWMEITNAVRIFIQDALNNNIQIYIPPKETLNTKINKKISPFLLEIDQIIDLSIRPAIQMDGGDIELISYEHGVLKVFLKGACSGCPSSQMTLKDGIEKLLQEKFPNKIKEVIAINN
jgi:Fe-S cluster biogenesis protein NfuA